MSEEQNVAMTEEEKMEKIGELLGLGVTLKDIKQLEDSQMNALYGMGVNFYKLGRYDDANTVFQALLVLDHLNQKYWIGSGAIQQAKRDFEKARVAYEYAAFLDITNPKPIYHAAECYLALGRLEDAEATLDALKEECPADNETNRLYLEKGDKLRELVEKVKKESDAGK